MKTVKSNKVLFAVVISFSAMIWILIFSLIAEPQNGRNFTIHIVDSIVLQADPPAKKLLKYMEEKYDKEFMQVLAGVAAEDKHFNKYTFGLLQFYNAPKYNDANISMTVISMLGMKNPHFVDSYIILCEKAG